MSEQIPTDWGRDSIGKFCEILDSQRIPLNSDERRKRKGKYPYYGANGVQDFIDDFIFEGEAILLAEDGGNFDQYQTRPIAQWVTGKFWVNNHAHILRAKDPASNKWVYYSLVHANILKYINGGTRAKLNQADLKDIELKIPPLPEQKKIAAILTSVDEVIENTQKQINKLQDLKKATMNELLTKGIGHTEFKDSELGRIPKSWEVKKLSELTSGRFGIVDGPFGSNLKTEHYRKKGIPVVQSGFVTTGKFIAKDYVFVDKEKFNSEIRSAVRGGDIVMAKIGAQAGRCAIIPASHPVGLLAGNSLKIGTDENVLSHIFLHQLLTHLYNTGEIQNLRTETAQPAISIATLKKFKIRTPTISEQKKIASILTSMDKTIGERQRKLQQTQSLKKSLMQDLLTGKVRVKVN